MKPDNAGSGYPVRSELRSTAGVQEQLFSTDMPVFGKVPDGVVLTPAERIDRIRRMAAYTTALDDGDRLLARMNEMCGFPPPKPWRLNVWMHLGVQRMPGRRDLPHPVCAKPTTARQWIAESDWRQRVERKRKVRTRFRRIVIARAEGHCHWCSAEVADEDFEIDHIIPVTRGGRSYLRNLAASCYRCNHEKGDLLPSEWLASWPAPALVRLTS